MCETLLLLVPRSPLTTVARSYRAVSTNAVVVVVVVQQPSNNTGINQKSNYVSWLLRLLLTGSEPGGTAGSAPDAALCRISSHVPYTPEREFCLGSGQFGSRHYLSFCSTAGAACRILFYILMVIAIN